MYNCIYYQHIYQHGAMNPGVENNIKLKQSFTLMVSFSYPILFTFESKMVRLIKVLCTLQLK